MRYDNVDKHTITWQLSSGSKRELSDIFSSYRLAEPITSRNPRSMYNFSKFLRHVLIFVCVCLSLTLVYQYDGSRIPSGALGISMTVSGGGPYLDSPDPGRQPVAIMGYTKGHTDYKQKQSKPNAASGNRPDTGTKVQKQLPHNRARVTENQVLQIMQSQSDDRNSKARMDSHLTDESVTKVFLLTYFRGGSSFLGEVFNHNDNAFYWFEPLAAPVFAYKREQHSRDYVVDDEFNAMTRPAEFVDGLVDIVQNIFECDIDDLDSRVMRHYFATNWPKSAKFRRYQICIQKYKLRHKNNVTDAAVTQCKRFLQRPCENSDIRVIKSIRMFVEEAIPMIHIDPDVKLVYYLRDPRGVLLSRLSLARISLADVSLSRIEQAASFLCAKMRVDLDVALQLRKAYPDRIVLLRYEDLATYPLETIASLYGFLGIVVPPEAVMWIRDATHARKSDGSIGTKRTNSSAVASHWQETLSPSMKDVIGEACADVIDRFYSEDFGYPRDDLR